MANSVKPVPEGFHTATPSLVVHDAAKAIEFYKKAFGAEERMRMPGPGGKIITLKSKSATRSFSCPMKSPAWAASHRNLQARTPEAFIFTCPTLTRFCAAVAAGGKANGGVNDMFWGDRLGHFVDPFGHAWTVATHVADLTEQEMEKGAQAFYASMAEKKSA